MLYYIMCRYVYTIRSPLQPPSTHSTAMDQRGSPGMYKGNDRIRRRSLTWWEGVGVFFQLSTETLLFKNSVVLRKMILSKTAHYYNNSNIVLDRYTIIYLITSLSICGTILWAVCCLCSISLSEFTKTKIV